MPLVVFSVAIQNTIKYLTKKNVYLDNLYFLLYFSEDIYLMWVSLHMLTITLYKLFILHWPTFQIGLDNNCPHLAFVFQQCMIYKNVCQICLSAWKAET